VTNNDISKTVIDQNGGHERTNTWTM